MVLPWWLYHLEQLNHLHHLYSSPLLCHLYHLRHYQHDLHPQCRSVHCAFAPTSILPLTHCAVPMEFGEGITFFPSPRSWKWFQLANKHNVTMMTVVISYYTYWFRMGKRSKEVQWKLGSELHGSVRRKRCLVSHWTCIRKDVAQTLLEATSWLKLAYLSEFYVFGAVNFRYRLPDCFCTTWIIWNYIIKLMTFTNFTNTNITTNL